MSEAADRGPWGPWADYGRSLHGAEEAVGAAVETILVEGGYQLWQRYLERKAFAFASNSIADVVVSQLRMCFVPYDAGEAGLDEGWSLEDEPEATEIDSWARMYLPMRRPFQKPAHEDAADRLTGSAGNRAAKRKNRAKQQAKGGKAEKSESRSVPITDQTELDEQEEQLRDAKAAEESRRRDKEAKLRQADRMKEEERKKVQQLHEEMSKRLHTFDNEGNIIWVEDIKPERLPKVQEAFGFNIKRDAKPRQADDDGTKKGQGEKTAPGGTDRAARSKPMRATVRGERHDTEFTDFFSKLQHGQPPILETMAVQPGVTLESMGKRKAGQDFGYEHHMSRKDYLELASREEAAGASTTSASQFRPSTTTAGGGAASAAGPESSVALSTQTATQPPIGALLAEAAANAQGGGGGEGLGTAPAVVGTAGTALPPLASGGLRGAGPQAGHGGLGGGHQATAAGGQQTKTGVLAQTQKEPSAPPASTRMRKWEAIGHLHRPPRFHTPSLGGQYGMSAAQPPLGATMGHGLVRHGSQKEAYFFPAPLPELGLLRRSQSETGPGSGRRSPHRDASLEDGRMKAEMSPAYRNFRHVLMPAQDRSGYL